MLNTMGFLYRVYCIYLLANKNKLGQLKLAPFADTL